MRVGLWIGMLLVGCSGPGTGPARPTATWVSTLAAPVKGVPPPAGGTATQPAGVPGNPAPERPTPTPWYPIVRYVAPSTLPYDAKETIRILPVYACPGQACQWLGDLPAGLQVAVTALSADGLDCFVRGQVVQGWDVEGWVSCSRLAAEKPVSTP